MAISSKRIALILLAIPVACGLLLAVTNPSEDRHINTFVARVQAWQAEHVNACPYCDHLSDATSLRRAILDDWTPEGIVVGGGLHWRNYVFFSAMEKETLIDARTIGFLGCVIGPTFPHAYPCAKDHEIVVPTHKELSDFDSVFIVSIAASGTISHAGQTLTEEELKARLEAIENKQATAVQFKADADVPFAKVNPLFTWAGSLGFGTVQISASRGDEP